MNKEKIDLLYTLGEADYSTSSDWLDYLHYGFDQTDIADLIVLSLDKKLHFADGDAMWVPIHAWRILGQLKSEAAVQPLISIFDLLAEQDDDFSLADLPHVMGMIGPAAILPLASFINDKTHHEFAQTMAMDGLGKIAQKYPEMRDEVLTCFQRYMAMPANAEDKLINGFLTSYLLDLQATELIEDIRSLFEQDCIDLSIVGDIEDVEMALGLRDERATPALSFAERLGIPAEMLEGEASEQIKALLDGTADTKPENDSEAVAMLDYYFMLHGNEESIIDVAELDGFCAALACSPNMIMPSTWSPAIWGGEALMPEWESIEEAQEFNDLLFFVYNQVIGSFNEDDFSPFFYIREVENKTIAIVDEWCRGFLRGVNLWGPLPEKDARIVEKELEPIRLFATPQGLEQLNQMNDLEIEQKQELILPATNTLYKHFLKQRKTPVTHTEPKVGRNDPCPCGSGKKYKKCCLH